jgi:lipoate-protein ligase A
MPADRSPDRSTGEAEPGRALSAAESFREDERAVRQAAPVVRATVLTDLSVSWGVGTHETSEFLARARSAGAAVLRRTTGGTGVLHLPGDLVWSLVLPRSDPMVGRDYARAYARLGVGVVRFLGAHGAEARWEPGPTVDGDLCVLSGRGEVVTVKGRILGGAAQHATARALLHHGMLARRVDPDLLGRIFRTPTETTRTRLGALEELGIAGRPEELARELEESIRASVGGAGSSAPGRT